MQPKVSIIVPSHNIEPFLERCVESLRNQTLNDIQIILVENGSSDQTPAICRRLEQQDNRIRLVTGHFADLSAARNLGVKHALAPWITFVDGDDRVDPDYCRLLLEAVESTGANAAYCGILVHKRDEADRFWNCKPDNFQNYPPFATRSGMEICKKMLQRHHSPSAWAILWPKSMFDVAYFPEGIFHEDQFTTYRWMCAMNKIAIVNKPLYHYDIRSGSIMDHSHKSERLCHDALLADLSRLEFMHAPYLLEFKTDSKTISVTSQLVLWRFNNYLKSRKRLKQDIALKCMRRRVLNIMDRWPRNLKDKTADVKIFAIKHLWLLYRFLILQRKQETGSEV